MRAVLPINEAVVEGALIIVDGEGRTSLSITRSGERSKELLYLLLISCRVDIPDDDHALQVGAVPSLVEGLDIGILEGLQYVETPDDIALGVLRAIIDDAGDTITEALVYASTLAPLFDDDATLLLRILLSDGDATAPVLKDEEHGVCKPLLRRRYIHDAVASIVGPGTSIEAVETTSTQEVHHTTGEVLSGFEGHVL